jgi:CDP-diacylglycerol--serine O-phosphatidyltransferase
VDQSDIDKGVFTQIYLALMFILLACIFDLFDGRVARMGGVESPFGREFDSLADLVSFGVAPAFLVYRIVLEEFPRTGWMVAAVYLACGALRLARFNILSMRGASSKEFVGLPIPAAAAMVMSVTLFMMWLEKKGIITPVGTHEHPLGPWRYGLPALMLLVSGLMVSTVKYPTFKKVDWTLRESLTAFVLTLVIGFFVLRWPEVTLSALFVFYLLYGLVRPWVSKRFRREIEIAEDEAEGE